MTSLRIAAVVVTYNRSAVLTETLRAVRAQSRAPARIYVVDNASSDRTGELLRTEFPDVTHIRLPENAGYSGGLAYGIQAASTDGFDAYWLMDDDSAPQADALETLLAASAGGPQETGIVGCRGGVVRFGMIRHVDDPRSLVRRRVAEGLSAVDFVLLDGSLVLGTTVDAIGVPRIEYFTMLEDVEYSLRARRAGFDVLLLERDLMRRQHLGSTSGSTAWRGYYQARNHLRMALDFRSMSLFFGFLAREAHFMLAALRAPAGAWERVQLRARGIWDGLRGRMGHRVEPGAARHNPSGRGA
jgi:rhamnopyranosyl-N-acetylglucosaminyl-diphospho-decaprenol beta-1,3/1,4-galactofuranosyltransferase